MLIAKELELTLTGRDCGLEERVPMIGFPYHASDSYFRKIRTRHQLVIMEDGKVQVFDRETQPPVLEEPKPAIFQDDDDDFEEDLKRQQYFDKDALCIL